MSRIIPRYLPMEKNSTERALAWIAWRIESARQKLTFDDLLRDGAYDLYRCVSVDAKKREQKFRPVLEKILTDLETELNGIANFGNRNRNRKANRKRQNNPQNALF